jgi:hypothetical protein
MGIGLNILANAAAGAVEGAGEGGATEGKLEIAAYNAQNHERIKQELEGERERQNAVLANKNKLEQQATEPRIIPAGGTLQRPGEPDYTAPIKNPPEQRAEFEARANYYNSLSESVRRGDRARNQKPTLPKIIVKDDGMGNQFLFDENSGAVGTIVHGAPAQEGKSHWFSADEPARPAQPNDVIWRGPAGDVLHNGLLHFYPDLQKRNGSQALTTTPRPVSDPLQIRPSLTSFYKPAPQPQPAAPQARPQPASQVDPRAEEEAAFQSGFAGAKSGPNPGTDLDVARAHFAAASAKVSSFGSLQRKRDPAGWERAKDELKDALSAKQEAEAFWQTSLGPQATGMPLRSR